MQQQAITHIMLNAVNATGASEAFSIGANSKTFHAGGQTTSGSGAAVIAIEVSNDQTLPWLELGTINLTLGTVPTAGGVAMEAGWTFVRARVVSISGTGAFLTVAMGL
jgi:hypothetical protein